jgi:hypothetical protein
LNRRSGEGHWINPLLSQLNLIQEKEPALDPGKHWKDVEESQLLERMSRVIAEVNGTAGYHVLEMLEYLPPQKRILQVFFDRGHFQYKMELLLRKDGIILIFTVARRGLAQWRRYFSRGSGNDNSSIQWEQSIDPSKILEKDIQLWCSYLLSGLNKSFRPDCQEQPVESRASGLDTSFRKASAYR